MTRKQPSKTVSTDRTNDPCRPNPRHENFPAQTVSLGKHMFLTIEPIEIAFTLPHRYHERLLHGVRENFREPQVLLSRRVGYLGGHQPVRYSLLAYTGGEVDHAVKVRGAALTTHEAWAYKALIPLKDLGIGIAKVLEHIAALPIHSAVPTTRSRQCERTNVTDSFCDTG